MLVRRSTATVVAALLAVGLTALPAAAKTDKQIAKAASITVKDLGRGWDTSKHVEDDPSGIPSCADTDAANDDATEYEFNSPDFSQENAEVTNSVFVFPNVKDAKSYLAAFQDPAAVDCVSDLLDEGLADTPDASVSVDELDVSGGPANDGVGFLATVTIPTEEGEATVILEAVAFRVGRGVTGITTQNVDEPLPITADLAIASIKRLKKGLK
ncbi:MAG TPA: hypothetical protein VFW06_06125 [Acidimicrobiia bacterium]|nr:hypothetical protein [Acidimicrobiia bacterium]